MTELRRAILGLIGTTVAASDQAEAMTDAELAERLLTGKWSTIEVHEAGRRLAQRLVLPGGEAVSPRPLSTRPTVAPQECGFPQPQIARRAGQSTVYALSSTPVEGDGAETKVPQSAGELGNSPHLWRGLAHKEKVANCGVEPSAAVKNLMHARRTQASGGRYRADGCSFGVGFADRVVSGLGRRNRLSGGSGDSGEFRSHVLSSPLGVSQCRLSKVLMVWLGGVDSYVDAKAVDPHHCAGLAAWREDTIAFVEPTDGHLLRSLCLDLHV